MKKVLFVGAFLFLGAASLTSCVKDYQCKVTVKAGSQSSSYTVDYPDLKKDEAKTAKDQCDKLGGEWSTK